LKTQRFEWLLGAVLAVWRATCPESPGSTRRFLRAFGLADDCRPVYMLNAMRYYPELKRGPGMEGVPGTPAEANAIYEKAVMPILFRLGAYPLFGGATMEISTNGKAHSNLDGFDPAIDDWSRILVVRYPSRRAFFELLSDPQWLKFALTRSRRSSSSSCPCRDKWLFRTFAG
jgi:hypothetical protein